MTQAESTVFPNPDAPRIEFIHVHIRVHRYLCHSRWKFPVRSCVYSCLYHFTASLLRRAFISHTHGLHGSWIRSALIQLQSLRAIEHEKLLNYFQVCTFLMVELQWNLPSRFLWLQLAPDRTLTFKALPRGNELGPISLSPVDTGTERGSTLPRKCEQRESMFSSFWPGKDQSKVVSGFKAGDCFLPPRPPFLFFWSPFLLKSECFLLPVGSVSYSVEAHFQCVFLPADFLIWDGATVMPPKDAHRVSVHGPVAQPSEPLSLQSSRPGGAGWGSPPPRPPCTADASLHTERTDT